MSVSEKLRVCHIPQVGDNSVFIVPVESIVEAQKVMVILAGYDLFQLEHNIKPDYTSACWLEMWDEDRKDWSQWELETADEYFDDVDEYCKKYHPELNVFSKEVMSQINTGNLPV